MISDVQKRVLIAYDDDVVQDNSEKRADIQTLYDGYSVSSLDVGPSYIVNHYDKLLYPLNGAHIKSYAFAKMQRHVTGRDNTSVTPLTQPDFHCPIATILRKSGYSVTEKKIVDACNLGIKFIYVFTLKYFYFQHQGISIPTENKNPYLESIKKQNYFKDILSPELLKAVNEGRCMLILNDVVEATLYDDAIINNLKAFIKEAKIRNTSNILLTTGNPYNAERKYPVNVIYWQYFENSMQLLIEQKQINVNYRNRLSYFQTSHEKTFRFLMLNNKTRTHRLYISYKLWLNNPSFFEQFCVSCKMRPGRDIRAQLSDDYTYVKRYGLPNSFDVADILLAKERDSFQKFLTYLPLKCFFDDIYPVNYDFNQWNNVNNKMYERTGIQIVTETLVEYVNSSEKKMLFLTEKTFKPISTKSPFIVLGQPGILKLLHQQGYTTFSEFWSEAYDEEEDPVRRADMIIDVVNHLSKLQDKEFIDLLKNMQDVVEHNFKVFTQRCPQEQLLEYIDKFYGDL